MPRCILHVIDFFFFEKKKKSICDWHADGNQLSTNALVDDKKSSIPTLKRNMLGIEKKSIVQTL